MINLLIQYILNKDLESLKKLKSLFENITYTTNKENSSIHKMEYCNSKFE